MKLRLIKTYKKSVVAKDEKGQPVIDALGREKRTRKVMFLYGLTDFTVEEKREYKSFRNRDGEYYREDAGTGTPLYHSNEFVGNQVELEMWKNEDGETGFSVVTTDTDVLESMMAQAQESGLTELAQQLGQQIIMKKLAGKTMVLKSSTVEEEEEVDGIDN
jgi:hypothetical protein